LPSSTVYSKTQDYALNVDVGASVSTTYVVTTVRQVWVAPGCTASEVSQSQETNAATGADVGSPWATSTDTGWTDTNCGLPTSLQALESAIAGTTSDGDRSYAVADGVMEQLSLGTASPAEVSALYNILASLPGVFDAGTVSDDAGRVGQAVGVQAGTVNSPGNLAGAAGAPVPRGCADPVPGKGFDYFVIDALTGAPLQVEQAETTPPCALGLPPAPTVQQYNVILTSGYVDKTGDIIK